MGTVNWETNEGNHVIKMLKERKKKNNQNAAFLLQITNSKHERKLKLWNGHWDSDKTSKEKKKINAKHQTKS